LRDSDFCTPNSRAAEAGVLVVWQFLSSCRQANVEGHGSSAAIVDFLMGRQYSRRFLVDACTVYRLVLMHLEPDSSDRINKQETSEKKQRTVIHGSMDHSIFVGLRKFVVAHIKTL
jgi:hypothetical protein